MNRGCWVAVAGILAAGTIGSVNGQTVSPVYPTLGGSPVCEASAGLLVACPNSHESFLLVGDNEIRDRLFIYEFDGAHLAVESRRTLPFGHLLENRVERLYRRRRAVGVRPDTAGDRDREADLNQENNLLQRSQSLRDDRR